MRIEAQIDGPSANPELGFWQRQFAASATRAQMTFDLLFGVAGPILCFTFDPIVFRNGIERALYPEYQLFAYSFSGLQILLLLYWLWLTPRIEPWSQFVGGMLLAGAIFCLALGIVLAPYSLMGLLLASGVFGFTPFLTAFVYLRNGVRALRRGPKSESGVMRVMVSLTGIVVVFGLPLLLSVPIHLAVNRAVNDIVHGNPQQAIAAAHRLVPLRFFAGAELDEIVNTYNAATDEKRKELLKSCYREITGEDIERRAAITRD